MWPFSKAATKELLQKWKTVKINGWTFTIRRLNPLLDFPGDQMPQIFSEAVQSRRPAPARTIPIDESRALDDMKLFIAKGVVKPCVGLKDDGKSDFTVDDLFRDGDTAVKLYVEILAHSLNVFRGLKGLFFWAKTRRSLFIEWQKSMGQGLPISSSMVTPP